MADDKRPSRMARWLHDRLFPGCIAARGRKARERDGRWIDSPEGRAYFEAEKGSS